MPLAPPGPPPVEDPEVRGAPRGVQIYDRPKGADNARTIKFVAMASSILISVLLSVFFTIWIW